MKTFNRFKCTLYVVICLLSTSAWSEAQSAKKHELIVSFSAPIIAIPAEVTVGGKELITDSNHVIGQILLGSNLQDISYAFPPDLRREKIVLNPFGTQVIRPNFSDAYLLTFPDLLSLRAVKDSLESLPDVKYADMSHWNITMSGGQAS